MVKNQVQIPDELYAKIKRIAAEREMSMAEVVRRGLEYIADAYPTPTEGEWELPLLPEGCAREDVDDVDLKGARDEETLRP